MGLIQELGERTLPQQINLFDHMIAEYLFNLACAHYSAKLLLDPTEKTKRLGQILSLTHYGARNALSGLHVIYEECIKTAQNVETLEIIEVELESLHTDHLLKKIFPIGADHQLLYLYTHMLSRLTHLAVDEMEKVYRLEEKQKGGDSVNTYANSNLPALYQKLDTLQKKAADLAETLSGLFVTQDKERSKNIYTQHELDMMACDYQLAIRPIITEQNQ